MGEGVDGRTSCVPSDSEPNNGILPTWRSLYKIHIDLPSVTQSHRKYNG
jgi:hypothetical protein